MSVVFDPFTGQIIDTGSSPAASIGSPIAGADPNAILVTDGSTNLADIQLADGEVLIGKTGDAPLAATITGTTNQVNVTNGANSITLSTPQDIDSTASPTFANVNLTPNGAVDLTTSGILNVGTTEATTINIGNAGTTVNIYGDTIYQNVTNLNVTDKNITVNNGGSADTSFNSGIHVYENGVSDAGYLEVTLDMMGWNFKAPHDTGVAVIKPGSVGFTIDQGSHNPVTIASPSNGLAIDDPYNQELSIALANSTTTGALSSTDWNTFNNKQSAFAFKVKAYDPVSATLPTVDPVVVDGYTILDGDTVLFSNLTNPAENNKIYTATISGGSVSWTENTLFIPNINDYVLVENGNSFAIQAGVFNGTSFDFNRVVRYFNGTDYWEQSAVYTETLLDGTANEIFQVSVANSKNFIIDYSVSRGVTKTTGTLYITTDGITAQVSDVGVDLNTPTGIVFSADIVSGDIILTCFTDGSGSNGEIKYIVRRWSDNPGGPGGLPSYSSGGGSGSISIEQVSAIDPTVPFSNINTIQFDHDTGFNVTQTTPGIVKVSLGSSFKTWDINNGAGPAQPSLVAVGEDTVTFVAGTNVDFETDNTLGAKTFTINASGGSPSASTVTLNNGATDQNVTGFIVDPTTCDGFEASIAITREVPSGIEIKGSSPLMYYYNTILQLTDGSAILYSNDVFGGLSQIAKVDASGNIDGTFSVGTGFNGGISKIIDVTEDSTNSVLAVFGAFTDYNGNTRNRVCFIDGNTGADLFDLYDGFGIASGGTGFSSGTILSATKIKYTSNIASSTSPYGYLIIGTMDYFNDMSMTTPLTSKAIIVSAQRGQGYVEIPNGSSFAPTAYMLTPSNKSSGTTAFSINGSTTLPSIPWSDAQEFFYRFSSNYIYMNDFSGFINAGMGNAVATATYFPMGTPYINSIDTNTDGSVLFVGGDFTQINSVSIKSLGKINVTSISSSALDPTFNPLSTEPTSFITKLSASDSFVTICGNYIQNLSSCQNYSVLNYDGSVNTSILTIFGTGFPSNAVADFSSSFFLQYASPPDLTNLYGYSAVALASYITKMYGCNTYIGLTPKMNINGYSYSGGIYPGVSFSINSSTGQIKYTSTNIPSGSSFTMKYLLTKL